MKTVILVLALLIAGCAAPQKTPPTAGGAERSADEILLDGVELLNNGQRQRAIEEFDKAVALCESELEAQAGDKKVYASRGMAEALFYMAMAASADHAAIAIAPTCADALYLRGFASLDSGQLELAEEYMNRAVAMAPLNARYLSELGHIYQVKRDWQRALDIFRDAEKFAETYSPEEFKEQELLRSKRGVGYSLIELGNLDEAEAKFRECVAIDRNDESALRELEYIKQLRGGETPAAD